MSVHEQLVAAELHKRSEDFHQRFVVTASAALSLVSLVALGAFLALEPLARPMIAVGICNVACLGAFGLCLAKRRAIAVSVLLWGIAAGASLASLWTLGDSLAIAAIEALFIAVMLAPFLLSGKGATALTVYSASVLLIAHAKASLLDGMPLAESLPTGMISATLIIAIAFTLRSFVAHAGENLQLLHQRLNDIDVVLARAKRIATGDLSGELLGEGEVAEVVGSMLHGLRELVQQIQETSARLSSLSTEISAMARQQEQSSVEQGTAVEETRQTIEQMLVASRAIASSTQSVVTNAETTLRNSEVITDRVGSLTQHTLRISEIVEVIRAIANKSELLALNAALEGAKAGEAGLGFSLVATQMQRMAEGVMESVEGVKALTNDIREATSATALATEDARKLSSDTTEAARRISIITQQQQSSTEQVTHAIDDIAEATQQTSAGTNQTLQAVRELTTLAGRLDTYVMRFRL